MPFTLIALMSLGRSVRAQGKNAIISNDHLRVLVEPENNSLSHKRTRRGYGLFKTRLLLEIWWSNSTP